MESNKRESCAELFQNNHWTGSTVIVLYFNFKSVLYVVKCVNHFDTLPEEKLHLCR